MNHADPWDEIARLQKQMDVELMRQLRAKQAAGSKRQDKTERAAKDETKR